MDLRRLYKHRNSLYAKLLAAFGITSPIIAIVYLSIGTISLAFAIPIVLFAFIYITKMDGNFDLHVVVLSLLNIFVLLMVVF